MHVSDATHITRRSSVLEKSGDEVDGYWKDDCRVLLGRDLTQRLEISQLERRRRLTDDVSCLLQGRRRLLLPLRRYHLSQVFSVLGYTTRHRDPF